MNKERERQGEREEGETRVRVILAAGAWSACARKHAYARTRRDERIYLDKIEVWGVDGI